MEQEREPESVTYVYAYWMNVWRWTLRVLIIVLTAAAGAFWASRWLGWSLTCAMVGQGLAFVACWNLPQEREIRETMIKPDWNLSYTLFSQFLATIFGYFGSWLGNLAPDPGTGIVIYRTSSVWLFGCAVLLLRNAINLTQKQFRF